MVRRELKNFELVYEGGRCSCTTPFTVGSVLSAEGVDINSYRGRVSLENMIYVDDAALAMKNFYLRVRGIAIPADIYIGERLICHADGITPVYNIDVAGLFEKGDNLLSIRFDITDMDAVCLAGLASPIEILRFSSAIIKDMTVTQEHGGEGVKLNVSLDLIGDPQSVRAVATLHSPVGQMYFAGLTKGSGCVNVTDPLYWWPIGQGVQNIYRLTVNLYGEENIEDSIEVRLGLRSSVPGENGAVVINGFSMLPMGALYIPEQESNPTLRKEKTEHYVRSAAMSNYNCLTIPLGAHTPSERFFELCDSYGIMVIEEHTLAEILDGSMAESLRKRADHPSLCLVEIIDPMISDGHRESIAAVLPNLSFRLLESAPEYLGLPALPSMSTICEVIPEGERTLFSHSIEAIAEEGAIRDMLLSGADRYPYPSDLSAFAYASAMASAHKVGDAIKESRLSLGKSGRAVFNRLSDPRMAISVSAIDSKGRWKPLQYYSARHFAPIALYADIDNGVVRFSASSQRRIDCIGSLEYRIADGYNKTIYKSSLPVEIAATTSSVIHTADIGEYIKGHEREYYLEFYIMEGSVAIGRKTLLFVPEKHFSFKKPKIKSVVSGQDRNFSLTMTADCFVKDMEIGLKGVDAVFEDNYFDVTSEAPIKINFTVSGGRDTAFRLKDVLEMRSVVDLIK